MSTNDLETFFPEGKNIKIAGQDFNIQPFVLKNRTKVLRILSEVFAEMAKNNMQEMSQASAVTSFVNIAGDKLVEIYQIVLGKDAEWLGDNVQLKDEIAIIQAVLEVNDIPFLISQIKGIMKVNG